MPQQFSLGCCGSYTVWCSWCLGTFGIQYHGWCCHHPTSRFSWASNGSDVSIVSGNLLLPQSLATWTSREISMLLKEESSCGGLFDWGTVGVCPYVRTDGRTYYAVRLPQKIQIKINFEVWTTPMYLLCTSTIPPSDLGSRGFGNHLRISSPQVEIFRISRVSTTRKQ